MAPIRVEINGETVIDHAFIPTGNEVLLKRAIPGLPGETIGVAGMDVDEEGYKVVQTDGDGKWEGQNVTITKTEKQGSFMIGGVKVKANFVE